MALLAGPSQAGEWSAVVGVPDLGLEAAAAYGLDLDRTVVVPRPGEHWLSVTAGLLEVGRWSLVRPYARVSEHQAERLAVPAAAEGRGPGLPGRLAPGRRHAAGDPLDLGRAGSGPRPPRRPGRSRWWSAPAPRRGRCRSGCPRRTRAWSRGEPTSVDAQAGSDARHSHAGRWGSMATVASRRRRRASVGAGDGGLVPGLAGGGRGRPAGGGPAAAAGGGRARRDLRLLRGRPARGCTPGDAPSGRGRPLPRAGRAGSRHRARDAGPSRSCCPRWRRWRPG